MPTQKPSRRGRKEAPLGETGQETLYLRFLSERTGVEVGCISTGPERDETILIEGSRLQALL